MYIHFPWCLSKCSYCDFNSFQLPDKAVIPIYVNQLLFDLKQESNRLPNDRLISVYFGGGTPSLIPPSLVNILVAEVKNLFQCSSDIEVTMEINPGTMNSEMYLQLKEAGINRVSLGVQSFNDEILKTLYRVHRRDEVLEAIRCISLAGFDNFNLDLMFALPNQSISDAIEDLRQAIDCNSTHLSWYHLSLDFQSNDGKDIHNNLPKEEEVWEIQRSGIDYLNKNGFKQYEISAYAKSLQHFCIHNLNYWNYGDYLGVGSGAHGKITTEEYQIRRYIKISNPEKYSIANNLYEYNQFVVEQEIPLEFMLNALRLYQPIPYSLFRNRTGIEIDFIYDRLIQAEKMELLSLTSDAIAVTSKGKDFLNNLLEIFL